MRAAVEVVPKLGVKSGIPALRIGGVATYDGPIEHLAGQVDVMDLRVPVNWSGRGAFLPDGASSWEEAREAMLATGWVDNEVLPLGAEVYATRYVRRPRQGRREPPAVSSRF